MRNARTGRRAPRVALLLVAVLALSGCTAAPDPPTVQVPSGGASTALPAPVPAPSVSGSASPAEVAAARARFDATNRRTVDGAAVPDGRAFVDALVAAGFLKSDMQVTADRTTIGLAVPSVQFSVLWRGTCLIGQAGPRSGGYRSITAAPVDGRCLIGRTRTIDW